MEIYAKSYDVKVWCIIKKENYPLPVADRPSADPEDVDEYTNKKMTVVQVNAKARNLLYNAINGEVYAKILSCDTAKEMWDKMEVTYEGTNKMKEGESIEEMFARFSKIISDLKAFDKPYLSGGQEEKKKTIAFKTTTEGPKNDIDDDPEALKEEIAMVSRNMNGLMRRYRNTKKGRMSSRQTRQYIEQDKNDGKCCKCESWSDEDISEHEEIANVCFMTILENDMNKYSGCSTDEDTSDDKWKEDTENCFVAQGEISEGKEGWKLKLEVCEIERDVLQDERDVKSGFLNGFIDEEVYVIKKTGKAQVKHVNWWERH
ncbi:uncharacterized protein [Nicotiana tomentosiformis]|uniref:uncharacterized protein n=1 Tax=Nicotiana tomentosiformis TaxID=4098 RepID=UPI00388CA850